MSDMPTPAPPCRLCLLPLGGVGGGLDGGCGGWLAMKEHGPPSFHGQDSADVTIAAVAAAADVVETGCWSRYVELTARWHLRGTLFGRGIRNLEEALWRGPTNNLKIKTWNLRK